MFDIDERDGRATRRDHRRDRDARRHGRQRHGERVRPISFLSPNNILTPLVQARPNRQSSRARARRPPQALDLLLDLSRDPRYHCDHPRRHAVQGYSPEEQQLIMSAAYAFVLIYWF
jgi:hypothetical protein